MTLQDNMNLEQLCLYTSNTINQLLICVPV